MRTNKKLVFIISSSIGGGAQILLADLANSLKNHIDLMVVCPSGFLVKRLEAIGIEPYVMEINLKTMSKIKKIVLQWANGDPCIINPFLFGTAYYCSIIFSGEENCKIFSLLLNPIIRDDMSFFKKKLYLYVAKVIGNKSNGIGVGSPELKNEVYKIMHRNPFYLENRVPNVVPRKTVFYDQTRPLYVCFVGRMAHQKRPDLFLKTAKITREKGVNIKYFMAGEGPLKEDVIQYIHDNCLDQTVELVGFINDLYTFLIKMDILLSSAEFENTPLIVLNAMNASLPVVTGNVVGVPHLIKNGVDGIVTDKYSAENFADVLMDLACKPEQIVNMSKSAYHKAITEYSFENFSMAYLKALISL